MKNEILKFKVILAVCVIVLLFVFYFLNWRGSSNNAGSLDIFAQCLADKNITMYGAEWCSHCQNEKKAFGKSFRYVSYVECTNEPQKCIDAGINGYPTWIFGDPSTGSGQAGRRFEGELGLKRLAEESGCELVMSE